MRPPLILIGLVAVALSGCETVGDLESSFKNLVTSLGQPEAGQQAPILHRVTASDTEKTQDPASAVPKDVVESGLVTAKAITDGDTLTIEGKRIRLHGIDAPEMSQSCRINQIEYACGIVARNALIGFAAGSHIRCHRLDVDRYGRDVSQCWVGDFDLSAGMVRAGLAVAYRKYSHAYVTDEAHAKARKRGMWKGSFTMPWDWRAGRS